MNWLEKIAAKGPRDDIARRWVEYAEQLSEENNGVLPAKVSIEHPSLHSYMSLHPDLFKHIRRHQKDLNRNWELETDSDVDLDYLPWDNNPNKDQYNDDLLLAYEFISTFAPKDQELLKMWFGLDSTKKYKSQEIADYFGVTRTAITFRVNMLLKQLKTKASEVQIKNQWFNSPKYQEQEKQKKEQQEREWQESLRRQQKKERQERQEQAKKQEQAKRREKKKQQTYEKNHWRRETQKRRQSKRNRKQQERLTPQEIRFKDIVNNPDQPQLPF